MPQWIVESARISLFFKDSHNAGLQNWRAVTGYDPEQRTDRPAEKVSQEQGIYSENILLISIAPQRADILLTPVGAQNPTEPPNIGKIGKVFETLNKVHERFSERAVGVERVAFGAILSEGFKTESEAIENVWDFLPEFKAPRDIKELFLQFNRTVNSQTENGIILNQFQKWSVAQVYSMSVNQAGLVANNLQIGPKSHFHYRVFLELDFSTLPFDGASFSGAQAIKLFSELTTLGKETALRGVKK